MARLRGLLELMDEALNIDAAYEGVKRLGLKEGNTAAERAKALGFSDDTFYHGTDKSFNEFQFNANNGAGGVGGEAIWFTDNPNVASSYADYVSKQNLFNAQKKLLTLYNKGTISNIEYAIGVDNFLNGILMPNGNAPINEYISLNNKLNKTVGQGSQVYPVKIKQGTSQSYDMAGESYKDSDGFIMDYMDSKLERAKSFKDDTTIFTNLDDHVQHGAKIKPSTHIAVNNPANIRSKFAKFNPKYAGIGAGSVMSADLLADENGLLSSPDRNSILGYMADSYKYMADEGGLLGNILYSGGGKALNDLSYGTTPMKKGSGRLPSTPTNESLLNLMELLQL